MANRRNIETSKPYTSIDSFNEICEALDNFIDAANIELCSRKSDDDRLITIQWHHKSIQNYAILIKFFRKYSFSVPQKHRILTLLHHINYLKCHFDSLMKRGAGLNQSNEKIKWALTDSAFNNRLQTGTVINLSHLDVNEFLDDAFVPFENHIKTCLDTFGPLKVYTVFNAKYKKVLPDGTTEFDIKYFINKTESIFPSTELRDWYNDYVKQKTLKEIEDFQDKESNWQLYSIHRLDVNINKYNPLRVGSFIDLPPSIKAKRACVNVRNEKDNECFKWAILSALYEASSNPSRLQNYAYIQHHLNFTNIKFPVALNDVARFEVLNNISVNVYCLVKRKGEFTVSPIHLTSQKQSKHVNLLRVDDHYIDEDDDKEDSAISNKFHYVWIKSLSRLINNQVSTNEHKLFICDRCLHYFRSNDKLTEHVEDCQKMNNTKIILPKPGSSSIQFKNFSNKEKVPFIIYADCESLLVPGENSSSMGCQTEVVQQHQLLSIGFYLKSYDDSLNEYRASPKNEEDPARWFAKELKKLAEEIEPTFMVNIPMDTLNADQKAAFKVANICHICMKTIKHGEVKVRDHCHLTGVYRGAAHQDCNVNYQDSRIVPVVFHNLSGYDAHFIIKAIANEFEGKIDVLPINKEKYISFTKHVEASLIKFRFIDSFRFMASSLDKLASYLNEYKIVKSNFSNYSDNKVNLLTRKGVFPYEYLDSKEKLEETQLPQKECFYSTLNDSNISDQEYLHAQQVWSEFNYPAHYYTTPGFTWDAMLKYTNVKLELLTDIDMIMFIERGIRGGISQCTNRYAKANNQYMKEHNVNEETSYIVYLDANNLYGWAMVQSLPYGDFKWVLEFDNNFNFNVVDDATIGYILEVDLDYPTELHNMHNDFPFCPEHLKPPGSKQEKLLTTLQPKRKYILHYRALKQALANGLKLVHIHRILQFKQSTWLKDYVDFNTSQRTKASNEFEKNLFKLMNNAVYGKTMENVRNHVNVKLVTKWEGRYGAEALIAKPNFHTRAIFNENLIAVELKKTEVYMNKPIYIGLSVLDISKTLMYDFHYDYMRKKYGMNCKLLYTDTDSLIYNIKCEDVYSDMRADIFKFDTSDYPMNNVYGIPQANKKVLGLMKDECNGRIVTEFVGLRSKMYSLRVDNQDFLKKAKGVKSNVVKNHITFNDYIYCLKNIKIQSRTQYSIRSKLHKVLTLKQKKIALSPYDDKRFLLKHNTDTLAWGHYIIERDKVIENDVEMIEL
ncbi:uncharacterized protein LOC127287531 [Leptopilina boulardi]|uniref:uncharacterized protein LOC127287531 n=1 Tax=Leptopilina boulardi TaxID=63433 RepID=UPI0021F52786|nr:uncharacterized protein LOC127287531 [Leptopilina boulardi]